MSLAIRDDIRSPNADQRPADCPVDLVVLHYTGMQSAEAALQRLCDPEAKVSAHYLVTETGEVANLVDPGRRAWHAGVSCWEGRRNLNDSSVGVELVNPGHEWGYRPFPSAQMRALVDLLRHVTQRLSIPSWRVVGHSDVAPRRKEDPGELFTWPILAEHGFGLWPRADVSVEDASIDRAFSSLAEIGYCLDDAFASREEIVRAFQRHFRPERFDGELDAETANRIEAVRSLCLMQRHPS